MIEVDIDKTKDFYLTQSKIVDDCNCDDCNFYANEFLNINLEIFNTLRSMGVDIAKNLKSQPTSVWCVRDDNGHFLYSSHSYQIIGNFIRVGLKELHFKNNEQELNYSATIIEIKSGILLIDLEIQMN